MKFDVFNLLQDLMETRAFTRVNKVSFLGIVDRVTRAESKSREVYSRAQHTIGVLQLGLDVVRHISLPDDDVVHLLGACLVHDLGHPPFSHSFEYAYSKNCRTLDHHKVLEEMLTAPSGVDREVVRVLRRHGVSPDRLFSIVDGVDPLSYFFTSPINIDTIDGISRSMWSFGFFPTYDPSVLVKLVASLYSGHEAIDELSVRHADSFWHSKGTFYRFLDSENSIAAAERNFQAAVRLYIPELTREHFRMTDTDFVYRYPQVIIATNGSPSVGDVATYQEFLVDSNVRKLDRETVSNRYIRVRHEHRRTAAELSQHCERQE